MHELRCFLGLVIPIGFAAALAALVLVARHTAGYRSAIAACGAVLVSAVPAVIMGRGILGGNWSASIAPVLLCASGIAYLGTLSVLAGMAVTANRHRDLAVVRKVAAVLTTAVVASYGALFFFAAQSSGG